MNLEEAGAESAKAAPAPTADLRQRLQANQTQLSATRAKARLLARELALTRRLLRLSADGALPARRAKTSVPGMSRRAVCLTVPVRFHLDACERQGAYTVISGWAFRPVPEWEGHAATCSLVFRATDGTLYAATTGSILRSDVAAYFSVQAAEAAGGAQGLEAAGFRCDLANDSLPAGVDLEVVLRLECAGVVCEQPTGHQLRL